MSDRFPPRLAAGYRDFLARDFTALGPRYRQLAEDGQQPEVMVVGCVDSRVSPEAIFGARPGEILVVRNVANIVPAYEGGDATQHGTSAALEFGVMALGVKHIVVLGHARCGGIRAFANEAAPLSPGDFIGRWMAQVAPAAAGLGPRGPDPETWLHLLERAAVSLGVANLMTFPWIRSRVAAGSLALHGAWFDIASGQLLVRDSTTGSFTPLAPADAPLPRRPGG